MPGRERSAATRRRHLLLCLLLPFTAGPAAAAPAPEEVQAALVYKFAQFVQWGPEAPARDSAVVVGLLGDERAQPALEAILRTKRLHGHRLVVQVFRRPEDVRGCRILLIDMPEARRSLALSKLPEQNVLTIGQGSSFAREGGVIAILLDGPSIGFEINLAAAERAGLTIDATLLGLARQAGRW